MDREKVIKGLECCTRYEVGKKLNNCLDCPYVEPIGFNQFRCKSQEMKEDALALLKEQEAVEPKKTAYQRVDHTIAYRFRCGMCDMNIFPSYKYCPFCGQAVKWE